MPVFTTMTYYSDTIWLDLLISVTYVFHVLLFSASFRNRQPIDLRLWNLTGEQIIQISRRKYGRKFFLYRFLLSFHLGVRLSKPIFFTDRTIFTVSSTSWVSCPPLCVLNAHPWMACSSIRSGSDHLLICVFSRNVFL